jgi:hypothetical protein
MVSKSRHQELDQLTAGAPFGRGIDHDKYSTIGILLLGLAVFGWYRNYAAQENHVQPQQVAVSEPFSTTIYINSARRWLKPYWTIEPSMGRFELGKSWTRSEGLGRRRLKRSKFMRRSSD